MTDKADNSLKESLSALVDGEAGELELRRVLKSGIDSDERQVWQRYQLASALMRGDCHNPKEADVATDFSAGVLAAIEADERGEYRSTDAAASDVPVAEASTAVYSWMSGFGKVAVAASVTLAMLLGLNQFSLQGGNVTPSIDELAALEDTSKHPGDTSAIVPEGYSVPSLSAMTVSSGPSASGRYSAPVRSLVLPSAAEGGVVENSPELQAQLQRMLILHSEKASDELGLTIVPISRLSSQDIPKE